MLSYLKIAGAGLFCAALIILGWRVNGWRIQAAEAAVLHAELRHELERRVASDAARLAVQEKLTQAQELLARKLGSTLKAIQDHAPKSPDCDVPDDVAGQLSKLRQAN